LKDRNNLMPRIDCKLQCAILAFLIVLGGWLRFAAIDFGLPDKFRPDEELLITPSLDLGKDWKPHFPDITPYPAAQVYLLHAVLRSYAMVTGSGTNLSEVNAANGHAPAYLIAREVSAAMGTATILAVYWSAELAFGPIAALCSAAIVAVSSIHVRESKFAKMQVPSGLWLVLAMGMMLRIARRGRTSDYALAGFFSSLAIATAYQSAPILFGVLAAHLEARHRENRSLLTALADSRIYVAAGATLLTFFCATPYTVLDPHIFRDYQLLAQRTGLPGTQGWWYLLLRVMPATLGVGLQVYLLLALVWVIFHPRLGTPGLLALTAVSFLSITVGHPALMYRYALNPFLLMALLAGVSAADLVELASRRLGTRWGIPLAVALFGLLLAPSVTRDLQLNRLLNQSDTRALARLWIQSHVPPLTVIAATDYDPIWNSFGEPQLPPSYRFAPLQNFDSLPARGIHWVFSDSLPGLEAYSPGPTGTEQAALNSEASLLFDLNPVKDGSPTPVFDPNDAFYVPFQHISSMTRPGPRIRIWMLKSK
jgi:hypothetical protein